VQCLKRADKVNGTGLGISLVGCRIRGNFLKSTYLRLKIKD
jgi:hypothetical protein